MQTVSGEKDWVYGVKYQGRQLMAGDKVPLGASLTLMIGNGTTEFLEEDSVDTSATNEKPVASETATEDNSWF